MSQFQTRAHNGHSKLASIGRGAASFAMCILCAPVYLIVVVLAAERSNRKEPPDGVDKSFFDYEYFKNLKTQTPHYLPRPANMDILDHSPRHLKGFNEQLQSTFASRLPLELRIMIYKYALGDNLLHLDLSYQEPEPNNVHGRELRCYPCTLEDGNRKEVWSHECWYPRNRKETEKAPGTERHLALLLSCRLIYAEAMDYLYSQNTFHFRNPACLRHLPSYVLPQRIDQIQSLKLCVSIDDDPTLYPKIQKNFEEVWEEIARLKGLKELLVDLRAPESFLRAPKIERYKEPIFGPLRTIANLDRFEMFLPIRHSDIPPDIDAGICQLRGWDERLRAF